MSRRVISEQKNMRSDLSLSVRCAIISTVVGSSLLANCWVQAIEEFDASLIANDAVATNCAEPFDADQDGDQDVVTVAESTVWMYRNNGTGEFAPRIALSGGANNGRKLLTGDVDGDGDLDLLSYGRVVRLHRNNGDGTYADGTDVTGFGEIIGAALGDLDGDGDLDIAFCSYYDDLVDWYSNDGTGTFSGPLNVATSISGARALIATDMDGDQDIDLVCAADGIGRGGGRVGMVSWFENQGDGEFGSEIVLVATNKRPMGLCYLDIDKDEDSDVAIAWFSSTQENNAIAVVENLGGGMFSPERHVTTEVIGAVFVGAADIDGDGAPDLMSASVNDNKFAWYQNDGGGSFGSQIILTTQADNARTLVAADLDGDHDLDLLGASQDDNSIRWYRQAGTGDADSDSISDLDEKGIGTDPLSSDSDQDGVPDAVEIADHTDPLDAHSNKAFSKGLVGFYAFSENVRDGSGNSQNGLVRGAVLRHNRFGHPRASYEFNGMEDIRCEMDDSLGESGSASVWIMPTSGGIEVTREIVHLSSPDDRFDWGFNISFGNDSELTGIFTSVRTVPGNYGAGDFPANPYKGTDRLELNSWHHLALVWGGGQVQTFLNGVVVDQRDYSGSIVYPDSRVLSIGSDLTENFFIGGIDDIRLYNRRLSEGEISALFEFESIDPDLDVEPPDIGNVPNNIVTQTETGLPDAAVTWTTPTITDDTAIASVVATHEPGSRFPLGTTTVTYTATDIFDNSSVASFTVTVVDEESPLIEGLPESITATAAMGDDAVEVTWIEPTATDNVAVVSFTSSHASGQSFPFGTTEVTYTAEDASGNTSTASFTVEILDPDTDDDGLADSWELQYFQGLGALPDVDADDDGLSNISEFELGTHPRLKDTDADSLTDGDEAGQYGTNPLSKDTDDDGAFDGDEIAKSTDPRDPLSYPAPEFTGEPKLLTAVGLDFAFQLTAKNRPTGFGATGLPPGLQVNTSSGLISGQTRSVGVYTVSLVALNGTGIGTGKLTIHVVDSFASWRQSYSLGDGNDEDDDGTADLLEFGLQMDPTERDNHLLPSIEVTEDTVFRYFTFAFNIPKPLSPELTITIEQNGSMRSDQWIPVASKSGGEPWSGLGVETGRLISNSPTPGSEQIRLVEARLIDSAGNSQYRIRVER